VSVEELRLTTVEGKYHPKPQKCSSCSPAILKDGLKVKIQEKG
jgi:hypothetical protein